MNTNTCKCGHPSQLHNHEEADRAPCMRDGCDCSHYIRMDSSEAMSFRKMEYLMDSLMRSGYGIEITVRSRGGVVPGELTVVVPPWQKNRILEAIPLGQARMGGI